jgi:ATP-binding cassette subfamily C protein LapB
MRHTNDNLNYAVQALQQISYIAIVITGSMIVISGSMTMGGLIACTILGGRILTPVMALPNLLVQASHAKAAQKNIESLYQIPSDNHMVSKPLILEKIKGNYQCQDMIFCYLGNQQPAVNISQLTIKAGERVALLGAIGSGKSTLLKILAGLYLPKQGSIRLDGIELQQISRDSLNEHIGYLQQTHRLFQGTLRENLLIGMPPPSDSELHSVLERTGLIRLVASHSSGLDLPISEGGHGLSGGQKQLLAFSRLVLTKPKIWLLDEPTASMDNSQEQQCLRVLAEELKNPAMTLIVATHKMELLKLVDRIIIMDNQKIVMDGSKQAVIQQLMKNEAQQQQMTKS